MHELTFSEMSARDANPPEGARNTDSKRILTAELLIPAKKDSSSTLDVGDLISFDSNPATRNAKEKKQLFFTFSPVPSPPNVYFPA